MSSEYEKCREKLASLQAWYKGHEADRNEATTRLHLVDELIFECLGWDKRSDCITEENLDAQYTDYTLLCPRRIVIIEAKREGAYFEIPAGYSNREYRVSVLKKDIPVLGKAISQAAEYCQRRGTPIGIVTNGHQLVAFIGSRQDGLAPEDGRAVVYESLGAMLDDFISFWQLFSKPGVTEKNLFTRLLGTDIPHLPKKLSQIVRPFPGVKNRNIIQADLQILADLIVEDIIRSVELEEEFLKKCYCQSGALSQYALLSKSILSHRYEALFSDSTTHPVLSPATTKKGISSDLVAESFTKRPVLILGDVGVGKTMFFRHFIKVQAKEVFENALLLYIDFGIKAAFAKDVQSFALEEIIDELRTNYGIDIYERQFVHAAYHGELSRFAKTIYGEHKQSNPDLYKAKELEFLESKIGNTEQHLISALSHISKGRKQQVVAFLDNADQRTDEIQQQVFIMAQSIAATWPCAVFLALRPETFQRSKEAGALSAYHLKAFTVAPPRIDEVLMKRLDFGLYITRGKLPVSFLPAGVTINLDNVSIFLKIVKDSLSSKPDIIECVDNLAGGNVRIALEFIKNLIGSGHIDTKHILEKYRESGSYTISLHQFLRSVTYGDNIYYDPTSSPILNLFDIRTLDTAEHFLALALLAYIQQEGEKLNQHGFVGLDATYDTLQGYGFTPDQIDSSLSRLCRKHLVETAGRIQPIERTIAPASVRLTSIGAYHLLKLPYMFVYYDAIITDAPILVPEMQNKILDVIDIRERLTRAIVLVDYLDKCYESFSPKCPIIDWARMSASTRANIENIREKIHQSA